MSLLHFFLFICIATIGGIVGYIVKLPIGTLIGAMFAVGLSKHFDILHFQTSNKLSFIIQLALGIMFGLSFIKLSKKQVKKLLVSFTIIIVSVIVMGVGTGLVVSNLSFLDTGIAILSAAPGGIPEMAMTAKILGLEAPVVVVLHLIRVILVMTVFTILLKYFYKKKLKGEQKKNSNG